MVWDPDIKTNLIIKCHFQNEAGTPGYGDCGGGIEEGNEHGRLQADLRPVGQKRMERSGLSNRKVQRGITN